jgi:hypothetical protein
MHTRHSLAKRGLASDPENQARILSGTTYRSHKASTCVNKLTAAGVPTPEVFVHPTIADGVRGD